jgi:Right handed beta helix region/Secretion system C-terminal sorting domain
MKKYLCLILMLLPLLGGATTWRVGATRTYTRPSQVCALVGNGDSVLIDAGTYMGDTAHWTANHLFLSGVGGMALLNSGGHVFGDKGIWVIDGDSTTVEYIEFSGAVADLSSNNGAGIRMEGSGITIRHCYFHDNQDGILTNPDTSSVILIEYSEFYHNGIQLGGAGSGYCHNLYIGHSKSLTFQYNYTHQAVVGHELKSRASQNFILYNRFSDEDTGSGSRDMDIPNGGLTVIIGNVIEKGPKAQNSNVMEYGLEGLSNADSQLYVVNNTFVNDYGSSASFVQVQPGISLCKMYNNVFAGGGTVFVGTAATLDSSHNWTGDTAMAMLVSPTGYNYNLKATSLLINRGVSPGAAGSFSLTPLHEYAHPDSMTSRPSDGTLDIGAYEYAKPAVVPFVGGSSIAIYPNPCTGTCMVVLPDFSGGAQMTVMDATGKLVDSRRIAGGETVATLSHLPAGAYVVCVTDGAQSYSGKIVVAKER